MFQLAEAAQVCVKASEAEPPKQNQCFYCDQVCQSANTLRRHCRQAHGKERCHVCRACGKAFKRATHLKVGLLAHTHTHTQAGTHTQVRTHICRHIHTHRHTHTHAQAHTYAGTYTCTHTHRHTNTHTGTHTQANTQVFQRGS